MSVSYHFLLLYRGIGSTDTRNHIILVHIFTRTALSILPIASTMRPTHLSDGKINANLTAFTLSVIS